MRTVLTTVAAAAVLAVPAAGPAAAQVQQSPGHFHEGELGAKYLLIEQALKCDCGCGLDIHSCQFVMQCGTSPVWSERIRTELEAGKDVEAIKAGFVADFGGTVLMAPPPEGFNLVGYLLPSFAIITAGMFVGLLVRRGASGRERLTPVDNVSDEDAQRLAAALRRLDEEESPDW